MKKAVYRKSSVGVMNPFFHHRKDNPFFSSANMGSEQIIASKEEESSENLMQKKAEEQESEDNLQMTESDEEQVQKTESEEEQVMNQTEEEVQLQEDESVQAKASQKAADASRQRKAEKIEPLLRKETGRGRPLEPHARESMEQAFGADFGAIRVHTNNSARLMNKMMHSQAFTYGNDIFFNENNYQPETKAGKQLLAHELTHTIQQKGKKNLFWES